MYNLFRSLFVISLFSGFSFLSAGEVKPWTFMVYMCADNDLEPQGIKDINRFEKIGSGNDLNILALFDRNPEYDSSEGDWTDTRLFYITRDSDESKITSKIVQEPGEINYGDPSSLVNFVKYCHENYPAEHYCLVLWNHGSGISDEPQEPVITKGICQDASSGYDMLSTIELGRAMEQIKTVLGKKLDVLEMDACLMGMLEVAFQVRSSVDFVTFSEEIEPWDGIPYPAILGFINKETTGRQLAEFIVSEFKNYYTQNPSSMAGFSGVTKSMVCTDKLGDLVQSMDNILNRFISDMPSSKKIIAQARASAQTFDTRSYIDLSHFMFLLSQKTGISEEITAFNISFSSAVPASVFVGDGMKNACGLAVYFPKVKNSYNINVDRLDLAKSSSWNRFVKSFCGVSSGENAISELKNWLSDLDRKSRLTESEIQFCDFSDLASDLAESGVFLLKLASEENNPGLIKSFLNLAEKHSDNRTLKSAVFQEVRSGLLSEIAVSE